MGAPRDGRPGLRERKKVQLRRAIQTEALRLFEQQGYEQTTVEQIADAADTSTTTFYRYFPTKEDVVLDDSYDAAISAVAVERPTDEPLTDTVRAIITTVVTAADADRSRILTRMRLLIAVPALDARYAAEERKTTSLFARLLAARSHRPIDDFQVTLAAAALVAVLFAASRRWAADDGKTTLAHWYEQSLDTIDPVLSAL